MFLFNIIPAPSGGWLRRTIPSPKAVGSGGIIPAPSGGWLRRTIPCPKAAGLERIIPSPSGGGLGWGRPSAFLTLFAALALLAGLLSSGTASANGAVRLVVIDQTAGPFLLRVGILPADPALGPLHLSILIQDAQGETAVDDATVSVAASGPGSPTQTEAANSPQTPQLYEGNLHLDALGQWAVTVDIQSALGQASHTFSLRAAEGGFNLMWAIAAAAVILIVGSLAASQLQRRRRLARER